MRRRCHFAFAYVDGEPADDLEAAEKLAIDSLEGLPLGEFEAWTIGRQGNASRRYRYTETRLRQLCESEDAGALSVDLLRSEGGNATVDVYLRHNHEIELRYQPPGRLSLVLDARLPETAERVIDFLRRVGNRFPVLHGGAGSHVDWTLASAEVSQTLIGSDNIPPDFDDRVSVDSRRATRLWNKARRAYPVTLIGASLAAELGSGPIASQFPDLDVEELEHGALIKFTTADAELTDPEFLRRSLAFRKRLQPHTIENPHDPPLG